MRVLIIQEKQRKMETLSCNSFLFCFVSVLYALNIQLNMRTESSQNYNKQNTKCCMSVCVFLYVYIHTAIVLTGNLHSKQEKQQCKSYISL